MLSAGKNKSNFRPKKNLSPIYPAVSGMICISPAAPFSETLFGLNPLSAFMTAKTRFSSMPYLSEKYFIADLYFIGNLILQYAAPPKKNSIAAMSGIA